MNRSARNPRLSASGWSVSTGRWLTFDDAAATRKSGGLPKRAGMTDTNALARVTPAGARSGSAAVSALSGSPGFSPWRKMTIFCGAIEKFLPHPLAFARFAAMRARAHELAMSVQHVLDLPSKIGGNIIAGLIEPQFDPSSGVL